MLGTIALNFGTGELGEEAYIYIDSHFISKCKMKGMQFKTLKLAVGLN